MTKRNGIVFVAFQTRMRMTVNSLQFPQYWQPNDNMDSINEFYENGIFNHRDEGRFTGAYYFNMDKIKHFMESNGFETIDLIGSSSVGELLSKEQSQYWEDQGEYDKLINFLITIAKDPSVLGISSHLLYIGK